MRAKLSIGSRESIRPARIAVVSSSCGISPARTVLVHRVPMSTSKSEVTMRRPLIATLVFLGMLTPLWAPPPGSSNPAVVSVSSAPSGSCVSNEIRVVRSTGAHYACVGSTWTQLETFSTCAVIENLAAADDNFEFWEAPYAVTITHVSCRCRGTCSTPATFTLEDRGGAAMTITGTNPTCSTTGNSTYSTVTAANGLVEGEGIAFDVTNAVSPETDEYTLCVKYTVDSQ